MYRAILVSGLSALLPSLAFASANATTAPAVTGAACRAELQSVLGRLRVNTPLQEHAPLLELDPEKLCEANKNAPLNRRSSANSIEESRICENTYIKTKQAVQDYKTAMENACKKIDDVSTACTAEQNKTACMAGKAREAATASQTAADALRTAKAQIMDLDKAAKHARDTFNRDLPKIRAALDKNQQAIDQARTAGNTAEVERLTKLRAEATAVRNGDLVVEGGLGAVFDQNAVAARRGIDGNGSTITSYGDLIPRQGNRAGLFLEQDTAVRTMSVFNETMTPEIQRRAAVAQNLNSYATQLDGLATRQTEQIAGGAVKNNTGSSSISMPNLNNAMAMTQAGAGLANTMNAQQAAAPAAAAPANSLWSDPGAAAQAITGLSGGNKNGTSLIGGSDKGGTPSVPGTGPGPILKDPKAADPIDPQSPSGSFGVASNGDVFVSGNNDLPPLGSTASRTPSSKPGESSGAEARAYGKKKKGEGKGEEQAACPPGQDCAALAAGGNNFSKGGSLGVPVVGAADPGLSAVGALDNLFGEIPGMDGAGGATTGTVANGGGLFGFGTDSPLAEVSGEAESGGKQGSAEVAPANSRSLFARVKVVHEKALKKGAVSLFHKKL